MHTRSSASRTDRLSASASEYTTTVWIPRSRQDRMIRSAISPRLAIKIFLNMPAIVLILPEGTALGARRGTRQMQGGESARTAAYWVVREERTRSDNAADDRSSSGRSEEHTSE